MHFNKLMSGNIFHPIPFHLFVQDTSHYTFFLNYSLRIFIHPCIYWSPSLSRNPDIVSTSDSVEDPDANFEELACLGEDEISEDGEDCDLPPELLRLVQ